MYIYIYLYIYIRNEIDEQEKNKCPLSGITSFFIPKIIGDYSNFDAL